ncbi:MAG: hypothetical protein EHM28_09355 [Spirochaetaceae bacterium]|nr:MAG: hypothetical protein EHM28_09355 [Spirochaetaceae bacterium]
MKRTEKLVLIFGLIIAVGIAGIIMLVISLAPGSSEKTTVLSPMTAPEAKQAVITFYSGQVFYYRNNSWNPVAIGDMLEASDFVKTLENSICEVQIGKKAILIINEQSLLRIHEVLHSEIELKTDAEILVGTVLCKIAPLTKGETVRIRSGVRAFGVRGTEFLVQRSPGQTICAVSDGAVVVAEVDSGRETARVSRNQEITINERTKTAGPISAVSAISASALTVLKTVDFDDFSAQNIAKLVKVQLSVIPESTEIHIGGQFKCTGSWAGLVPAGTEIAVTLRKKGFREQSFKLTTRQGEDRSYVFRMELDEPERGIIGVSPEDDPIVKIEKLELELQSMVSEKQSYAREIETLRVRTTALQQQLDEANRKIQQAREQLR